MRFLPGFLLAALIAAVTAAAGAQELKPWTGGATPGSQGPAVIAGHVDSKAGPAVFFRLRDVHKGDTVWVWRRDGRKVRFVVSRVLEVPKTRFPSAQVYGPTADPTLRLITCGGVFNHSTGHYLDNIIVFASFAGSTKA